MNKIRSEVNSRFDFAKAKYNYHSSQYLKNNEGIFSKNALKAAQAWRILLYYSQQFLIDLNRINKEGK